VVLLIWVLLLRVFVLVVSVEVLLMLVVMGSLGGLVVVVG